MSVRQRLFVCVFVLVIFSSVSAARAAGEPVLRIDPGGHKGLIWDIAFTKDGYRLITAGDDKTVRVWNLESGQTARTILGQIGPGHEGKIYCMALSPDQQYLAVAGWMGPTSNYDLADLGSIRLFDFQTGQLKAILKGHMDVVFDLAFSPDGKLLASGSADESVRVFQIDDNPRELAELKGHKDHVYGVAFSPDGSRLVSGGDDNELRLWRTTNGSLVRRMRGHTGRVRSLAYSPDGKYIVSGSWDMTIKLWDGKTGKFIKNLATAETTPIGLSFSPDGTKVVSGIGEDGPNICHAWEVPSGRRLIDFDEHENIVLASAVSPDSLQAATGGFLGKVFLWSLEDGETLQRLSGVGNVVWSLGISPDGREIAWGNANYYQNHLDRGPLERILNLKDGPEWQVSLGGSVNDPSRFLRAVDHFGPYSLQAKVGGQYGYDAILQILKNGKVKHEIERDSSSGFSHRCYTFTPTDGKIVISGGATGTLAAYDVETGEKITDFIGHEGEVWAVVVSPDGRFLVSGAADQTIRIWDLVWIRERAETHPLLSIFVSNDRDWVAWTPKGYYSCSIKGDRYMGWHINRGLDKEAEYYPAERFAKKFFRPDVVAAVLETGDVEQGIGLAGKVMKTEVEVDVNRLLPPTVLFIEPESRRVETSEAKIMIRGAVKSVTDEPVTEVKLLHNGRPVVERDIKLVVEGDNLQVRMEKEINLVPGENTITLIAANSQARSNPETITVIYEGKPHDELFKPNLYMLAVGVSDYEDTRMSLNSAHNDAVAMTEFFRGQEGRLYSEVNTKLLINEEATRDNILDGLDWLIKGATQKDLAVLFVAGHGINDERGGYYFMPHDAQLDRLRRSGVEWFHFQDALTGIPSKIILLADTCHSGNITGSRRRGLADMTAALKELVAAGTGVAVLSAATGREVSIEKDEWGHGAFTLALLEGLRGAADYDQNGLIEIKELDLFVTHRVKDLTGGTQHPTTEIPASLPNFPLALK